MHQHMLGAYVSIWPALFAAFAGALVAIFVKRKDTQTRKGKRGRIRAER